MLLGGRGSLGREGQEAKIDREMSIYILCTDDVWLPGREVKGEFLSKGNIKRYPQLT